MGSDTFTGSCLCGSVQYTIEGEAGNFFHCHCSRCRRSTGTGHASNLFVKTEGIDWSGDESLRRFFKLPEAKRFGRAFCGNCGSVIPAYIPDPGVALIPAGTLTSDNDIKPTARIFCDSRTNWSCHDDVPEFENYPTK